LIISPSINLAKNNARKDFPVEVGPEIITIFFFLQLVI
tara:strand:- start:456 stop:569 length:114 start_codon:yes stop_codon:yes gene_type:complete